MPEQVDAHEAGRPARKWTLHLYPNGLRATPADGGPDVHLLRAEVSRNWRLAEGPVSGAVIAMKTPRKVSWQLSDGAFDRVAGWLGYREALRLALRLRMGWTLPVGILFVLSSAPMPGDAAAGLDRIPFNAVSFALGSVLLLQALASRFWTHRAFFALDSLWFASLAADTLWSVVRRGHSVYWLLVVVFQLLLMLSGVRLFRRYAPERAAWSAAAPVAPSS